MTTETTEVTKIVNLIKPIHEARSKKNEGERADKLISPVIKGYLRSMPSDQRELWDMEADPPIGVELESTGGRRWLDTSELTDETVIWAVRRGLIEGLNADLFDSMQDVPEQEALRHMIALNKAVKDGSGEKLVMLPKRRGN